MLIKMYGQKIQSDSICIMWEMSNFSYAWPSGDQGLNSDNF